MDSEFNPYDYTLIVSLNEDGVTYAATVEEIPGVYVAGNSSQEVSDMLFEKLMGMKQFYDSMGWDVPDPISDMTRFKNSLLEPQ